MLLRLPLEQIGDKRVPSLSVVHTQPPKNDGLDLNAIMSLNCNADSERMRRSEAKRRKNERRRKKESKRAPAVADAAAASTQSFRVF